MIYSVLVIPPYLRVASDLVGASSKLRLSGHGIPHSYEKTLPIGWRPPRATYMNRGNENKNNFLYL